MLTPGIRHSLVNGAHRLASLEGVEVLLHGPTDGAAAADPVPSFLATVSSAALRAHPTIADELFGPALVVVYCENVDDLIDLTRTIPRGLTATIHAAPADAESSLALLRRLRLRVGRILFGGFPTGVRVGRATNHGGPFPATTAPSTTSVGVRSIDRFLRPVTYQDLPQPWFEPAMAWM